MTLYRLVQRFLLYSSPLILLVGLIVTFVGYLNSVPAHGDCNPELCRAREKEVQDNLSNSRVVGPILIGISALLFIFAKVLSAASSDSRRRRRALRARRSNVNPSSRAGNSGQSNFAYDPEFTSPPPPYREAIRMKKPAILHSSTLDIPSEPPPSYNDVAPGTSQSNFMTTVSVNRREGESGTSSSPPDEVILDVTRILENAAIGHSQENSNQLNEQSTNNEQVSHVPYTISMTIPRFSNHRSHNHENHEHSQQIWVTNGLHRSPVSYFISF